MSTAHGATSANADDDDDPVIATFNVFLNPALLPGKRLLALGNGLRRDAHASTTSSNLDERDPTWGATPSEVRLKPKVGVMEMDVPRDVRNNYDHAKGIEMGTAMRIARDDGALNFFGEAGGMGVSAPPPQPRRKDRLTELGLSGQLEWDEAVKADQVLMQYTLAGKFVKEENKRSEHLIGIIQGGEFSLLLSFLPSSLYYFSY
jgi:DNA-directed RNA polymerase-3 subunit RPC5